MSDITGAANHTSYHLQPLGPFFKKVIDHEYFLFRILVLGMTMYADVYILVPTHVPIGRLKGYLQSPA